jgi:hypothetical protein
MVKLTGGGYNSRQVSHRHEPKTEPETHKGNPAGVAQQGMAVQFKKEPVQQGPHTGYEPGKVGATGIAGATKGPAGAGPGGYGRTIYRSGSQMQHGPVAKGETNRAPDVPGTAPGRDILSDYGPERRR